MDNKYINRLNELIKIVADFDISETPNDENYLLNFLKDLKFKAIGFFKIIPSFERITVNKNLPFNENETIREIKHLKYPPKEYVNKYGRANIKNNSILYATFHFPTAFIETNPEIGDLITISNWELKDENTSLFVYPVFDYFKTHDYQLKDIFNEAIKNVPDTMKDLIIVDTCYIASCFRKHVEKGKEINYTLSAHIADKIFKQLYDGKIEAILYPSVKDATQTNNIALKPEVFNQKYKLKEVRESIVINRQNGEAFLKEIKRTKQFDNENILW